MLETIISTVKAELEKSGVPHVYSAFDCIPAGKRTGNIFTIVDIGSFESSTPIYTLNTVYIPYKAEVSLRITAPEKCSADDIYRYYDSYISTITSGISGRLVGMTVKYDSNIRRLVMTVRISLGGIIRTERRTA